MSTQKEIILNKLKINHPLTDEEAKEIYNFLCLRENAGRISDQIIQFPHFGNTFIQGVDDDGECLSAVIGFSEPHPLQLQLIQKVQEAEVCTYQNKEVIKISQEEDAVTYMDEKGNILQCPKDNFNSN